MDDTTQHVDELLPWYVSDTLDAVEKDAVRRHLDQCARCREEAVRVRAMRNQIRSAMDELSPAEFGLNRLLRDVRKERRTGGVRPRRWWGRGLAIAASLVIVLQAAALLALSTGRSTRLVPLAGPEPAGTVFQVRFAPTATEEQIRTLLNRVGGEISSGPGALGVYHLRIQARAPLDVEALRRQLLADSGVVTYVRPE